MVKTDFFWTDTDQAIERLCSSVVLYDDKPVYVVEITRGEDTPKGVIYFCADPEQKLVKKLLNSPKFSRFRELPKLGWCNLSYSQAVFLNRRVSVGRSHGLTAGNITVYEARHTDDSSSVSVSQRFSFDNVMNDQGFVECHEGVYPKLSDVLINIRENSTIAYSRTFAVLRDYQGLRWLYRGLEKVGLFSGADTLNLLQKYNYLREEITADKAFTLATIREF